MNPVIPIAEFSQRVKKAQALMVQKGIDVMFAILVTIGLPLKPRPCYLVRREIRFF